MYYLKNTNFWMFSFFFFFYFFIMGAYFPFFQSGYMILTISVKGGRNYFGLYFSLFAAFPAGFRANVR